MAKDSAFDVLAEHAASHGLVAPGSLGVVLVSGGADSACLAAAMTRICGAENVSALHLNYRLRDDSDLGETACRDLCGKLRIDLHIERTELPAAGNLQDLARSARYRAAERLAGRIRGEWIAVGHSRTDLAETTVYRLASSPGSRALTGMPRRSGQVVRPLLDLSREELRGLALDAGLPFVDDPSNDSPRFARNRIRHEVMPRLNEINAGAERNIAQTHAELSEEADLLERITDDALRHARVAGGSTRIEAATLAAMHPALVRLALRRLAERATGGKLAPVSRARADDILRLGLDPEGGIVELPGARAVCEAGHVTLEPLEAGVPGSSAPPDPVALEVPGACRLGGWRLEARLRQGPTRPRGPDVATLDAAEVGPRLTVRTWREGDRIRPLGMRGTKSLQDLFTDVRLPRSRRRSMPVVTAGERVAWVPGVAVSEDFRLRDGSREAVLLSAVDCAA